MGIHSDYTQGISFFGNTDARELADAWGTPLYVYSENILRERCRELVNLSSHSGFYVNYSVKANSNPALLAIIRSEGLLVDAMSPGELRMDMLAGYEPQQILYISNNNAPDEMLNAISHGCLVSVDSLSQLDMYGGLNPGGRVMVRINPGIGEGHNAKVVTGGSKTKFGIEYGRKDDILALLKKHNLILAGINQHIGSLFMRPKAFLEAASVLLQIAGQLPSEIFAQLEILDFGGGFGIPYHKYQHEERLDLEQLGNGLHVLINDWVAETGYKGRFLVEPGRYVAAECGLLLGRVTAVKTNAHIHYVGTDIGFNVLQRPVMYDSFHDLEIYGEHRGDCEPVLQTVVGNICESGDILAKDRLLPPMRQGDVIGVLDAGAYGFSMASNYNSRLLPAEVLIGLDGEPRLIRRRQSLEDLESCLCEVKR